MAKYERKNPRSVTDRLRWLAPHAESFSAWLGKREYGAAAIIELTRLLACWAEWMQNAGFDMDNVEADAVASAAVFRGDKTARAPQGAAVLFIDHLRQKDVLAPEKPSTSSEETWPILVDFRRWMREQRGGVDSTLDVNRSTLIDLLTTLGADPAAYTATAVRDFVLERANPHGRGRARSIAVATRAYYVDVTLIAA